MQRKILNTKYKLHSIPILNKIKYMKKDNVLYSIPCGCIFTLLLIGMITLFFQTQSCAALDNGNDGPVTDAGTISPVTGTTNVPPSASLSLSKTTLTSSAISPGDTVDVSTDVIVDVSSADSYSLTLKMDRANLTNGGTTIEAGTVTTDNTWGYKWDNASSYTVPTADNTTLSTPALNNGAAKFTKTLTFGAKFANTATPGHYTANGTLSLVATPRAAMTTLANLTQMQQITPEICTNTPYLEGQTYSAEYTLTDVRDNNKYTVRKFGDGRCWMTQNLRLTNYNIGAMSYPDGRLLIPTTSDVASNWTLPASNKSGFDNSATAYAYYDSAMKTGYYSWCAATAGTCSSATANGANAPSSICPKGWKLPTGGDFGIFMDAENIAENSPTGSIKIQGAPYNFTYTGYMTNVPDYTYPYDTDTRGNWWSRTAYDNNWAYDLAIMSEFAVPTPYHQRQIGYAVRCIADNTTGKTFTVTFDKNDTNGTNITNMPAPLSCTTTSDSCTVTLPSEKPTIPSGSYFAGWDTTAVGYGCGSAGKYAAGSQFTLTSDTTLYAVWARSGCWS